MCLTTIQCPNLDSPYLLGMPSQVKYTTWHTLKTSQLVDKEPSHHLRSSFFQLHFKIKWHSDGFAIHAKMFENLLEIPNLVDVNKMLFMNPFHLHA